VCEIEHGFPTPERGHEAAAACKGPTEIGITFPRSGEKSAGPVFDRQSARKIPQPRFLPAPAGREISRPARSAGFRFAPVSFPGAPGRPPALSKIEGPDQNPPSARAVRATVRWTVRAGRGRFELRQSPERPAAVPPGPPRRGAAAWTSAAAVPSERPSAGAKKAGPRLGGECLSSQLKDPRLLLVCSRERETKPISPSLAAPRAPQNGWQLDAHHSAGPCRRSTEDAGPHGPKIGEPSFCCPARRAAGALFPGLVNWPGFVRPCDEPARPIGARLFPEATVHESGVWMYALRRLSDPSSVEHSRVERPSAARSTEHRTEIFSVLPQPARGRHAFPGGKTFPREQIVPGANQVRSRLASASPAVGAVVVHPDKTGRRARMEKTSREAEPTSNRPQLPFRECAMDHLRWSCAGSAESPPECRHQTASLLAVAGCGCRVFAQRAPARPPGRRHSIRLLSSPSAELRLFPVVFATFPRLPAPLAARA